ncbi:uncharacterized protein ACWYII_012901, partial [Salvelinus alpinus]
ELLKTSLELQVTSSLQMAEKKRSSKTHELWEVSDTMERAPPIEEVFQYEEVGYEYEEVSYENKGDILDNSTTSTFQQKISVTTKDILPEKVSVQKDKKSDMKHEPSLSEVSKRKDRATKVFTTPKPKERSAVEIRSDLEADLPAKQDRSLQRESHESSTEGEETLLSVYTASLVSREEEGTGIKTKGTPFVDVVELKTEQATIEDIPIHQVVQSTEEHFVQKAAKVTTKDSVPIKKETVSLEVLNYEKVDTELQKYEEVSIMKQGSASMREEISMKKSPNMQQVVKGESKAIDTDKKVEEKKTDIVKKKEMTTRVSDKKEESGGRQEIHVKTDYSSPRKLSPQEHEEYVSKQEASVMDVSENINAATDIISPKPTARKETDIRSNQEGIAQSVECKEPVESSIRVESVIEEISNIQVNTRKDKIHLSEGISPIKLLLPKEKGQGLVGTEEIPCTVENFQSKKQVVEIGKPSKVIKSKEETFKKTLTMSKELSEEIPRTNEDIQSKKQVIEKGKPSKVIQSKQETFKKTLTMSKELSEEIPRTNEDIQSKKQVIEKGKPSQVIQSKQETFKKTLTTGEKTPEEIRVEVIQTKKQVVEKDKPAKVIESKERADKTLTMREEPIEERPFTVEDIQTKKRAIEKGRPVKVIHSEEETLDSQEEEKISSKASPSRGILSKSNMFHPIILSEKSSINSISCLV